MPWEDRDVRALMQALLDLREDARTVLRRKLSPAERELWRIRDERTLGLLRERIDHYDARIRAAELDEEPRGSGTATRRAR